MYRNQHKCKDLLNVTTLKSIPQSRFSEVFLILKVSIFGHVFCDLTLRDGQFPSLIASLAVFLRGMALPPRTPSLAVTKATALAFCILESSIRVCVQAFFDRFSSSTQVDLLKSGVFDIVA